MIQKAVAASLALLPLQDNHQAVAGLIWRPIPPKSNRQAIRQWLQQYQGEQLIVHQNSEYTQCGIAPKLPAGQHYYSAALLLKAQLGEDWVAIFEYKKKDHYLLFGLHEGQVVPGCDGLFTSAQAVLAQFERYQPLCKWSHRYAPTHFKLGGEALELATLLNSQAPLLYPLKTLFDPLNNRRFLAGAAASIPLLGILIYGRYHYREQQRQLVHKAQQQLQLAQKQLQQRKRQSVEAVWRQSPPAGWLMDCCIQQISWYPLVLGGWQLQTVHCHTQGSQAIYKKPAAHPAQNFIHAAKTYYADDQLSADDHRAQIQQPLPHKTIDRSQEKLQPINQVYQQFQKLCQGTEIQGELTPLSVQSNQATFTLRSANSPRQWLSSINLEGVVIQQLDSHLGTQGDLQWSLRGTLYGH